MSNVDEFILEMPKRIKENETAVVKLKYANYSNTIYTTGNGMQTETHKETTPHTELLEDGAISFYSSGFEIQPNSTIEKKKGEALPILFAWTISPKKEGKHSVILDISKFSFKKHDTKELLSPFVSNSMEINGEEVEENDAGVMEFLIEVVNI